MIRQPIPPWRNLLLHRQRNPEIRWLGRRNPSKARLRHADNRVVPPLDVHRLPDCRRISLEVLLEPSIARDGHCARSRSAIIALCNHTPQRRRNLQNIEVASRNQVNPHMFRSAAAQRDVAPHLDAALRRDARERLRLRREFLVKRI